jgi:ribonuclease Z
VTQPARLTFLGTAFSIATAQNDHTHFVVRGAKTSLLVDAPSPTVHRLQRAGVDPTALSAILLTHFHPDHVSGVWLLLMDLWLMGRKQSLPVIGLKHCIERVKTVLKAFDVAGWEGMYPIEWVVVDEQAGAAVWQCEDFAVTATPVMHFVPCIALRFIHKPTAGVLVYSADTQPCQNLLDLVQGADWLIHEATGLGTGHTSPEQAGWIAEQAQVKHLALVHYDVLSPNPSQIQAGAQAVFGKDVLLAQDFNTIEF